MNEHINIADKDDLLNKIVVDIKNDALFFEDDSYIDIAKGVDSCCNWGRGTVKVIDNIKLPAIITDVKVKYRDNDEVDSLEIKLFGENAQLAEIYYNYYETGYYGSMTTLEVYK